MANETHWELTFIDIDNTERIEVYPTHDLFAERIYELENNNLLITNTASGSNA
jgi:hypothetical protein